MIVTPQLEYCLKVEAALAPPLDLGTTDAGHRRVIPITGGHFEGNGPTGTFQGRVVPGGADWQILRPDGGADLEARYVLEAADGALISVINRGMRRGDPGLLQRLNAGEAIDPAAYYFRTVATFETSSPAHRWMGQAFFIGSGKRGANDIEIAFWRVA